MLTSTKKRKNDILLIVCLSPQIYEGVCVKFDNRGMPSSTARVSGLCCIVYSPVSSYCLRMAARVFCLHAMRMVAPIDFVKLLFESEDITQCLGDFAYTVWDLLCTNPS